MFTIFTKDFGRLEVLGKAIRKISSKLRAGIDIFYLSEIEFIRGRVHKTLTDAVLMEKFKNLRTNLERLNIASKISEVLNGFIKGQEPDKKLWDLLIETFNKLNNQQLTINEQQLLYYYFFWNFLSILGYQLETHFCALCQKKLAPENLYFQPEGGIICQICFKKVKSGIEISISPQTIKILRIILKKNWQTVSKLKMENEYLEALDIISEKYYSYYKLQ